MLSLSNAYIWLKFSRVSPYFYDYKGRVKYSTWIKIVQLTSLTPIYVHNVVKRLLDVYHTAIEI